MERLKGHGQESSDRESGKRQFSNEKKIHQHLHDAVIRGEKRGGKKSRQDGKIRFTA